MFLLIALFYVVDLISQVAIFPSLDHHYLGERFGDLHIFILGPAIFLSLLFVAFGMRRSLRVSTDVLKRLQAAEEDALFERQRIEGFANAASDWFWETDVEHRYTWLSERVEEFLTIPRESQYGKTRVEAFGPNRLTEIWDAHLNDLRNHRPFKNFEFSHDAPDGVKWIRSSGIPFFTSDGAFLGYRGTSIDITEAMLASDTYRVVEQNFRTVIEHSIQGLLVIDGADLVFVNQALVRMFGYDSAEVVLGLGRLEALIHPEELDYLKNIRERRFAGEFVQPRVRWRGLHKDGSIVWVESTTNIVE